MLYRIFTILFIALLVSCVPARKYEEIEGKQKLCAEELESLRELALNLETENKELKSSFDQMKQLISRLKSDTTLLGKSLRIKEKQYDKINDLNKLIQEQLETLQKGSANENQRLIADLSAARLDLQKKEDELRILERELNKSEKSRV